jgi:outer membrane protein assembly factor BamB
VVWASQVWLTNATEDGRRMSVVCLDLETGRVIHDILLRENENSADISNVNSYASPTPAIEEGRLYAHFGSYGTFCLDTSSGKTLWARQDLKCDHEVGPGSSVVLRGDRLFLSFDGPISVSWSR